ncbi:lysine-specific demethylase 5B-B isoform X1 [Pygocentrus nattereri]|uniref:[histone H3]-trimethyl-L-lysine(4) demethylase n=1 Tax=Pygocentrus nattereri TaxID=42514 RepID=A0A3B4E5Z4_PYGNA|nr:lysine-specific demethylase 5B-B isoform X1 [Pygocentrus nattereri]
MSQPRPDEFKPPPECPVFEPSWEEFADPFAFINKIRPIAEKTGICKVRPPPDWQPPFACDVDRLHFTPRIQRLNELEAQTRVKLNFLDQIAKFWELQGCTLKIPHVERKILDLYQLNKLVADEGGFDVVCKDRRWTKIATTMGFAPGKAVGSHLRAHYERIIYPYNLFQSGANLLAQELAAKLMSFRAAPEQEKFVQNPSLSENDNDKEYKPHDLVQRQNTQVPPSDTSTPARRAKRMKAESGCGKAEAGAGGEMCESRPNLRRRMGSFVAKAEPVKEVPIQIKQEPVEAKDLQTEPEKPKSRYKRSAPPPLVSIVDLYVCLVCGSGSDEDKLLLCDGCDDSYHTFCLIPPLHDVPKGDWRCPKCLAQECSKPQEAFGFEQARRDYSLKAFGEMADSFKSDYFNMPVHMVPTELVEKEFWRLVGTIEEDVTVEYGADIASKEFGSGFPIKGGKFKVAPHDEKYLSCGWNLNNMAMMDPSVLTHVTADICGMTLPWLYVGMCFSSFCWHIEDHWSYSINYLHWGEPKTWYGAPGFAAEQLEAVMKKLAPELFESQPDLLHQLVTIMNPNTLMAHGVPIYRTNQCAGEFVITFPRAYHSGFNQGFNFAEAVNFCTVDWMPLGRQCVDHYRLLHRYCVFSHDEMICNMAAKAEKLNMVLASAVHKDMVLMVSEEKDLRDHIRKMGVVQCELFEYDLLQDDERQCVKCRTTCYLSALTCPCRPGEQVCLHHAHHLCSCSISKYTLKYRFTLDDLFPMMNAVKQRAESYDEWASRVTEVLEAKLDKKRNLSMFHSLIEESDKMSFPDNDLLRHLKLVTQDAERCSSVAQQLLKGKRQTRYRTSGGKSQNQLTVEELRSFVRQLYNLPCSLTQAPLLKEMLNRIEDFQQHSEKVLSDDVSGNLVGEIQSLLDESSEFDVCLPEVPRLRERLELARWLAAVRQAEDSATSPRGLSLDGMRQLIDHGVGLTPHPSTERAMARLQELLTLSEQWEEKAQMLLRARPSESVEFLSATLKEVEAIPTYLPNCLLLQDSVNRAKDWLKEAEGVQAGRRVPVLDTLSEMVLRGRAIPVQLDPLERLEALVSEVQAWKESAAKTFLLKNSSFTLLEVLCPRCEVGSSLKRKMKKTKGDAVPCGKKRTGRLDSLSDVEKALSDSKDSASAMVTLGEVRLKELESLASVRAANESKLLPSADCGALKVCVCQKPPMGAMRQCELCRDAFHRVCVGGPVDALDVEPWLCQSCHRSSKPPLDKILPLLASLQRIRVRLPEGDALRYMIERTVSWQRRARELMTSYDLSSTSQEHKGSSLPQKRCGTDSSAKQSQDWSRCSQEQSVFYIEQRCIPLQGLSAELEELMVEGLLLQVSLPETEQLYSLLLNGPPVQRSSQHTQPAQHSPQHLPCHSQEHTSPHRERDAVISAEKKAKRRIEKEGLGLDTEVRERGISKRKKQRMSKEKRRERKAASVSASPSYLSDLSPSDDSEEDMILCPAESCLQPAGDEVYWVQCDCCNQWFHMVCVGVSAKMAAEEDYMCVTCSKQNMGQHRK